MLAQDTIRQKRLGKALSSEAIHDFCQGLVTETWGEGQIAALAMAICCRGMNTDERVALTLAMRDSGEILDWTEADLDGPIMDKHSTGGVGDGVSLVLGPLLAACGAYVPMISGRGLGHTGGTLDKLESIPGYQVTPDLPTFRKVVREVGVAIIGQTASLAPADGKLYAIRDVTGTVESIDLITASILSKKLAAGLGGLVMDVKVGNGAFMPTEEASREMAQTLVEVANGAGLPTTAVLTDMNQCLSSTAGNALEIRETVAYLKGDCPSERFHQVVGALGSEALLLGKLASSSADAQALLTKARNSGAALESFQQMVQSLGGPEDFVDRIDQHLSKAPITAEVPATQDGVVSQIDTRKLGMSIVSLGGGRQSPGQSIDHAVGLADVANLGTPLKAGEPLALIHARTEDDLLDARRSVQEAFTLSESAIHPSHYPTILDVYPSHTS